MRRKTDYSPQPGSGHSHLEMCVGPDGQIRFFPSGDGAALTAALRKVVEMFVERPTAILCAVGVCKGEDHAHPS